MTMGTSFLIGSHAAVMVVVPLLAFVALPALAHAWAGAYTPAALHLGRPAPRHLLAGVLLILPVIAISIGVGKVQEQLVDPKLLEQGSSGVMEMINQLQSAGGLGLLLLCVAVAPGICEEILCRGTLLAGLRQGLGITGGVLVSAFLFAVLHLSPWRFAPQCAVGIALALLCLRCGSIWPGVIVHTGHNALLVVLELAFAGTLPTLQPLVGWLRQMPPAVGWAAGPFLIVALGAAGWRLARR
jgi:membrane protease YdiL (CAAX protease family)